VGTVRVIFQDDVQVLRDQVERELGNLDSAATTCPTLDVATLSSWNDTLVIVRTWLARVDEAKASIFPTDWAALYGQGRGLENTLRLNWWPRLSKAGCRIAFPQPSAPPEPALSSDNPSSPLAWLGPLEGIAKALLLLMLYRELKG
jgi:hypothetical protein